MTKDKQLANCYVHEYKYKKPRATRYIEFLAHQPVQQKGTAENRPSLFSLHPANRVLSIVSLCHVRNRAISCFTAFSKNIFSNINQF